MKVTGAATNAHVAVASPASGGPATTSRKDRAYGAEFTPANSSDPVMASATVHAGTVGGGSGGADIIRSDSKTYFAGLSFWPERVQAGLLRHHGDLYTRAAAGWPRVDVRGGELSLTTVNAAPFGVALPVDGALPAVSGNESARRVNPGTA